MMMLKTCVECMRDDQKRYLLIPGSGAFVCESCFTKKPDQPLRKISGKRRFIRWRCKVHECGSYNFSMLGRHEMPWCDISTEETVGLRRPKTYGGINGNVGRAYFKDWIDFHKQKDEEKHAVKRWKDYRDKHGKRSIRIAHYTKRV